MLLAKLACNTLCGGPLHADMRMCVMCDCNRHRVRMCVCAGGSPYAVLGVVDTLQSIKPDVQIVALGCTYSYSSLLLVRAATYSYSTVHYMNGPDA